MSQDRSGRRVLVVDDDPKLLRLLSIRLERAGYVAHGAANGSDALVTLSQFQPDVVITDVRMDGIDGLALFQLLHEREPTLPVIILTAHGTIPDAVEATQRGVFAYMTKPFDSEDLLRNVERALRMSGSQPGGGERAAQDAWCEEIVTASAAMRALLTQARKVAQSSANVILLGESGTGKELLARAMHRASLRRDGPFMAVNCAAVPESLFESEFFGHRRGAFTGATRDHRGLLEAASGGTLLLDEVADMPASFQAKLLRVLQEREVRPVGVTQSIPVDVRVMAASHQDLQALVDKREFREDLFYRLSVVALEIPPLRARREDIAILAEHFLGGAQAADARAVRGFSPEAMEILVGAAWPGNVRQLRNVVEQCVVLATTPLVSSDLVERALRGKRRKLLPFAEARDRFELDYLIQLLKTTRGNVAQAARLAERNRSEFYSLLKKHGLKPETFREPE